MADGYSATRCTSPRQRGDNWHPCCQSLPPPRPWAQNGGMVKLRDPSIYVVLAGPIFSVCLGLALFGVCVLAIENIVPFVILTASAFGACLILAIVRWINRRDKMPPHASSTR